MAVRRKKRKVGYLEKMERREYRMRKSRERERESPLSFSFKIQAFFLFVEGVWPLSWKKNGNSRVTVGSMTVRE